MTPTATATPSASAPPQDIAVPILADSEKSTVLTEVGSEWRSLAACVVGVFLGTLPSYGIGVFVQPVAAELNRSLTEVLGWSIFWSVGVVVAAPLAGIAADKFGAKRVALFAVVALALALGWACYGIHSLSTWYLSAALIGIAAAGAGGVTFGRIVITLFDRGLGTALGIMTTGVGLAGVIGPRLMQAIIDSHGWRTAFAVQATIAVVALPLLAGWIKKTSRTGGASSPAAAGLGVGRAARTPVFWLLLIGTFLYGLCVAGVQGNLMPYLTSEGMTRAASAGLLGLFGAATVTGRLITGIIIDKAPLHASVLIALMLLSEASSFAILSAIGHVGIVPVLIIFGFAVGAEGDCLAYLVSRFFGHRSFSTLFGILGIAVLYIGTGVGPVLFNLTRDHIGEYSATFAIWACLALISAMAFALTVRTPFFNRAPHDD